jgi:hypothetical protein
LELRLRELAVPVAIGAVEARHDFAITRRFGERKLPVGVEIEGMKRTALRLFDRRLGSAAGNGRLLRSGDPRIVGAVDGDDPDHGHGEE